MRVDRKILEEINRYKSINKYIMEQGAPIEPDPLDAGGAVPPPADAAGAVPPPPADAAAGATPPPPPAAPTPEPIDVSQDPDVEEVKGDEDKEEMDITDLVNTQKNIETKQEEYFDNLFKQLENLESKLGDLQYFFLP